MNKIIGRDQIAILTRTGAVQGSVLPSAETRDSDHRCRIIETAERLFRQIGFQKTTVADIARELRMSPANIYRFFGAKSEINEAVGQHLMNGVNAAVDAVAAGPGTASDRLRGIIKTIEAQHEGRFIGDRKLHEMVSVALDEQWPIIDMHIEHIGQVLARVIGEGMESGEFAPGDPEAQAKCVHMACIRFCHPRLMVECADKPGPDADGMVEFCLRALRA